ncbi:MAG: hypothetical protein R2726_07975 [Acidimicrobiales bacterium]
MTAADGAVVEEANADRVISDDDREAAIEATTAATEPGRLATLAEHPSPIVRMAVAANPRTPESALVALARDTNQHVVRAVAANAELSATLLGLLGERTAGVDRALARNRTCPPALLSVVARRAAHRRDVATVESALAHPHCSLPLLHLVAASPLAGLLVDRDDLDDATWDLLARHPDPTVRRRTASSATCPVPCLVVLAGDPDTQVADRATAHRALVQAGVTRSVEQAGWVETRFGDQVREQAADPATAVDQLGHLVRLLAWARARRTADRDSLTDLGLRLARNPSLTPPLARRLLDVAEDEAELRALAQSPAATGDLLVDLLDRGGPPSRAALAEREDLPDAAVRRLADDPESAIRAYLTGHAVLPPDVLDQLARDREPWIRALVGRRPDLPAELADLLAHDDDPWVRWAVDSSADEA